MSADQLNFIVHSATYIVAAPFVAGLLIILGLWRSKTISMALSVGAVTTGFFYSLLLFYAITVQPSLVPWQVNVDWLTSPGLTLSMGVLVDNLVAVMMIIVTTVSLLVQIYTHGYMRDDPDYSRFYAYLSLFTGSMLGLVVATNLFETYFFWELVGVCSYFLIGFWWYKTTAAEAALKAFFMNRIGDCGFLIGILILLAATKDFWGGYTLLGYVNASGFDLGGVIHHAYQSHALSAELLTVAACLTLLGPIAKSAQFPLHTWLPDAMEGPTPISALIHAATMVAAGVYLIARAYPIWLTPDGHMGSTGLAVITGIGAITAFMAATIALSQFDIKRILAWSTVSQLGYMFVGLGTGAYSGGIFHLFNHAFFKAMLFLCSGAVIHGLHGEQDIRKMGGLRKYMPITAYCCLIGTLSISGCPGLSGFFSKDEIIASACKYNFWLGGLMIFTAFLTAFYMFRLYFMTFETKYRGDAHPHESPPVVWLPLVALAVPSVLSGYLGFNLASLNFAGPTGIAFDGHESAPLASQFASFIHFGPIPHFEGMNGLIMVGSTAAALLGFILAWAVYITGQSRINNSIATSKQPLIAFLYDFSFHKWKFDELYMALVNHIALPLFSAVWRAVDMLVVDNFVDFTGFATMFTGKAMRYIQNGRAQYYALVIFAWVAGLTIVAYLMRP